MDRDKRTDVDFNDMSTKTKKTLRADVVKLINKYWNEGTSLVDITDEIDAIVKEEFF